MKHILLATLLLMPSTYLMASELSANTPIGKIYVDESGKSLYTFTKDSDGQSVCTGDCAVNWPPLLAEGKNSMRFSNQPGFSKITRANGKQQWAKDGKPLYRWFQDVKPGDILGAGFKGVWPLARADDVTIQLYNDGVNRYLVDNKQLALYTFDKDKANQSVCYDKCATNWPPAYVNPELTSMGITNLKLSGNFGVTQRSDGQYQWTYQGKPLYRWFKDKQPGDKSGDGVQNVWHLIKQ
jgi:predicted lipoprotein with Yx(FWY)xxD motif